MVDIFTHDGQPWEYCPRSMVRKVANDLKEKHGLELKIGFEIEFAIFNLEFAPVEFNGYCNANSLDLYSKILEDVVLNLHAVDIEVLVVHKETGPGQYEIVLGYGDVLETLDKYFMARELIKGVLRKYSLLCSFIPKSGPITQNGAHVHMSLWKEGRNITVDQGMKHKVGEETNSFIAGILKGLPALLSLITPTFNGLKRLMPDASVGAVVAWGVENKEAPLRFMAAQNNFELKTMDHTANHYYALAAIMNMGSIGITEILKLGEPLPTKPRAKDFQMLPTRWENIEEYVDKDEAGELLKKAMGEEFIEINMKLRKYDIEHYFKLSLTEEVKDLTIKY